MRLLQFLRRRARLEAEFLGEVKDDELPVRVALGVNDAPLATWLLPVLAPYCQRSNCWSNTDARLHGDAAGHHALPAVGIAGVRALLVKGARAVLLQAE